MKFPQIFATLRKPSPTSAELRETLAGIDVQAAESAVDTLEAQRRKLLLQDGADLDGIEARIKDANRTVERLAAARDELQEKLTKAEERERAAAVEQTAAEGRAAREALLSLYVDADSHAAALADILTKIGAARETMREANRATLAADRLDLKVADPFAELAHLLGKPNSDCLPNPLTWTLGGYWPLRDRFGGKVDASHPLARVRELMAPAARKAA